MPGLRKGKGDPMKLKLIQILPFLILTGLLLSAFGSVTASDTSAVKSPPSGAQFSVNPQETAEPTTPPIIETVLVPVTGEDNTANNNNANLLVYVLIGIAGLAFLIALVAILTRSNQAPTDKTHSH
jgi:hypothetical protein